MEAESVLAIFERSERTLCVRYTEYLGDGDWCWLSDAKIYDMPTVKLERAGHIQKRMGRALLNVVAENKNQTYIVDNDGALKANARVAYESWNEKLYSGLGGPGRLIGKAIKQIQGHFGAAVQENDTVEDMQQSIWALYSRRNGVHDTRGNWCPGNKNLVIANKSCLPRFVMKLIKPVVERLAHFELLSRCTHGGTQNANESFHNMIWQRCPKARLCGETRLQLAVVHATICYNNVKLALESYILH